MTRSKDEPTKSESTLGEAIISGLEDMRDTLRNGEKLHHRFTMRTVELDLHPTEYSAADLRRVRNTFSASQRVFAMLLGVEASTLQKWEQGKSPLPAMACRLLEMMENNPELWMDRLESSTNIRSAS